MKEMMNSDEQFEQRVKASLDARVDALDADTRKRLTDIRRKALNTPATTWSSPFAWLSMNHWLPAGGLALASLFAVFLVFSPQSQNTSPVQSDRVAVLELLDNSEELNAITDADFYAWVDENLNQDSKEDAGTS